VPNINKEVTERVRVDVDWKTLAQNRDNWRAAKHEKETWGSAQRNFVETDRL
jgi:hypothetical protein